MALLDKLGDIAKKGEELAKGAVDKAGDFIDAKKEEVKIAAKEDEIVLVKAQIGDFYFQKYLRGESLDIEPNELCGKVQMLLNDIDVIKNGNVQPSPTSTPAGAFCQNCGTALSAGAKFCPSCGMKTD